MRKATVFTLIFGFLTLTFTHGANAADCTVVNDCADRVRVAYATWMAADGTHPEGYRVTGWFYIDPRKEQTFSAKYDIYVRVEGVEGSFNAFKAFKLTGAAEEDDYLFSVCSTENRFTTVETDDRGVIYSSVQRNLLSETSDFYAFTQDATVKVKETGMDLERRLKHEHFAKADSANASTYSCTAPVISPTPPRGNQTYGEKGQAVTPPGVVDVEKTAVTTKEGFWQRSDTVSIIDDHLNSPLILTVQFLDTNSEYYSDEIAKQIEDIANIWARYGYIEFKFVKFGAADIYIKLEPRIAKDKSGKIVKNKYNEPVRIAEYSSYIGRDAKGEVMNLCFPDWEHTSDAQKKRIILHEFGHALGFHHEHKNINLQIDYNIPGIVAYYKDKLGWSAKQTKTNTFGALDRSKWNFTEFDPNSIMLYPLQQFQKFNGKTYKLTNNPISFTYNTDLSEIDKAAIKRLYPGRHAKSKRTKSGNGLKTKVYKYSVSGKGDLRFGSFKSAYKDWNRKYVLPRGTIESIRNVTTRAHKGYVKEWTRYETDKIVVAGKIEPGATIYGRVDGYLEVIYLPE